MFLTESLTESEVSIRFQTTFLPVPDEEFGALEFAPEMYNYQTRSDADPKNLLLLCTTQGSALQQVRSCSGGSRPAAAEEQRSDRAALWRWRQYHESSWAR